MERQPQNPEFRNNPENFHPWHYRRLVVTVTKTELIYLCRTSKAFKKLSVGVFPFSWK